MVNSLGKIIAAMGLGGLAVLSANAWARGDLVPGSRYTSARAAAMGDAFLPLADDGASSLFYNPAGIGKIRRTTIEALNLQVQANSDYASMVDRNFYKVTSLDSYAPTISGAEPKFPGVSASLVPNLYTRYFAAGVLVNSELSAQGSGTSLRYRSKYQVIPALGTGFRLASGVVRLGYSLQWVNQASGDRTIPLDSENRGYNEGLAEGSGLSHTAGFALTLPYEYLPAFNVVARNIGGLRFNSFSLMPLARNKSGTLATEPMSIDASVSIQPKTGRGGYLNLVFEYRDITNRSGMSIMGRAAAGLEFSFRDLFFLRGGWGSGYPSAGIGLRRKTAEFSLAWFSEEAGTQYHDRRDTRFVMQYQVRAF